MLTGRAGVMLTGRVVRFDEMRGYGFIAPDKGGEDVFVHANVLGDDKYMFCAGLPVEFEVTEGERGLKAHSVHICTAAVQAPSAPPPVLAPRGMAPSVLAPRGMAVLAGAAPAEAPPAPASPDAPAPPAPAAAGPPPTAAAPALDSAPAAGRTSADRSEGDEDLCDLLTASSFSQELTDLLLESAPTLTGAQITQLRRDFIELGRRHGWVEG